MNLVCRVEIPKENFENLVCRVNVFLKEGGENLLCRVYVTPDTTRGVVTLDSLLSPSISLDSLIGDGLLTLDSLVKPTITLNSLLK